MLLKVCGLTRYEDVLFCDNLGVDLVGFIFFKKSPRYISVDKVKSFCTKNAKKVGVFVDHSAHEILQIIEYANLDLVQLHGKYSDTDCEKIGTHRIILTKWPDAYKDKNAFLNEIHRLSNKCLYFLFDAGIKGGGHGTKIKNISFLKAIPEEIKWIIAGGISSNNIEDILCELSPDGIDVNSGVEISKGIKDKDKIMGIYKKIKELR